MKNHSTAIVSGVILAALFAFNTAHSAPAAPKSQMTLETDLLGDATTAIQSYQFGAGLGVSSPRGGDRTVSEPSVSEITITRDTDGFSPVFFNALTNGMPIGTVKIHDGNLTMELDEVIISGYSLSASQEQGPLTVPPSESMSLNFTNIKYTVEESEACYDLAENETGC